MIEFMVITAVATFINISGVKTASDLHVYTAPPQPIVTVEDVSNNEPESLLEMLREQK